MKLISEAWILSCFDRVTEGLVVEYELQGFDEKKWTEEILGIPPGGDILGGYEVLPEHMYFVKQYIPEEIDLSGYDCIIELCGRYEWDRSK